MTLGVSSSGMAEATLGKASPAIPPTMAATFAKDSLRETSALDFELIPANALADGASTRSARVVVSESFMV